MKKIVLGALVMVGLFSSQTRAEGPLDQGTIEELLGKIDNYMSIYARNKLRVEAQEAEATASGDTKAATLLGQGGSILDIAYIHAAMLQSAFEQLILANEAFEAQQKHTEELMARISKLEGKESKKVVQGKRRSRRRRA